MFNQIGGSRTDTLIKLVLVFFLSLLSFSVGTFVGKQFSDSQHKIADLENNSGDADRSTASIPSDATKPAPGQAISEEEITKLSDEFMKKEKVDGAGKTADDAGQARSKTEGSQGLTGPEVGKQENNQKAAPSKTDTTRKTASVHDEIADVSKKIAAGAKVEAPKAKPSRIPSSLPKELANSSIGKFTVQISSMPDEAQAKSKAQELKDKGLSAFYVPATVKGKTWYRVSIGLFDNRKEAMEYRTKLMKDESIPSAIVEKIAKQ